MTALPKAAPLSGLPGTDPPPSNTDEPLYSVKHQPLQLVRADAPKSASRIEPLGESALLKVTKTRRLRLRARPAAAAFGSNHPPEDQAVIDLITRNIKILSRSHASKKGWCTRKRLAETRKANS